MNSFCNDFTMFRLKLSFKNVLFMLLFVATMLDSLQNVVVISLLRVVDIGAVIALEG